MKQKLRQIYAIVGRECRMLARRPVFFFVMILAPVLCVVFFTSLMAEGLPTSLPAAIVDEDNTATSRNLCRVLDAMQLTDIRQRYPTYGEAHRAMRRGEIYAFFYIPKGTTEEAVSSRQPKVSFYTNDAYLVPGNLLMKEMKTTGELVSLALTREKLRAAGLPEDQMMAWLQPIQIEAHPIGNPTLDYNVYLSNMVVPGIFILLILLTTVYTIGMEWKNKTQRQWYSMAGHSVSVALGAKLLPQTVIYIAQWWLMDLWFYWHCGFPVTDMHPVLQGLAVWFPLRHYYLIYVNQALDGFPLSHVWSSVCWLVAFCVSPLLVHYRYRKAILKFEYMP